MKAVRIHEHVSVDTFRYEEVENPELTPPTAAAVKSEGAASNHLKIWNTSRLRESGIKTKQLFAGNLSSAMNFYSRPRH